MNTVEIVDSVKTDIDRRIAEIRSDVTRFPPGELLRFAAHLAFVPIDTVRNDMLVMRTSEKIARYTEYIQSLVVTTRPMDDTIPEESFEVEARHLFTKIEELQHSIDEYLILWAAHQHESEDVASSELSTLIESQLDYHVRGNRYMCFQRRYYELLLPAMQGLLEETFGCSPNVLIDGLIDLDNAVSQGMFSGIQRMLTLLPANMSIESAEDIARIVTQRNRDKIIDSFSLRNYDVKYRTNWPDQLINLLTYEQGEASWPKSGDYSFWPCSELPIWERPFIRLNGRTYCFDHYTLEDNFYRMLQSALKRSAPETEEAIGIRQQAASESAVEEIFVRLLPGYKCLTNSHYGPKKRRSESDLIVLYRDILLAVEIKAGRMNHAMPITDWEGHKSAYRNLLEKPDHQCQRVLSYIMESKGAVTFFNKDSTPKAKVDKSHFTDFYAISVTVENINAFAARIEKLAFLSLQSEAISVCLDDLLVYEDYFDSPLVFMHHLKQRRRAMEKPQLHLLDELDHLGLYITDNMYSLSADEHPRNATIIWEGCREGLDRYYESISAGIPAVKPSQHMPSLLGEIIACLERSSSNNVVEVSSRLLDLSSDTRKELCSLIESAEKRERVTHRETTVLSTNGSTSFDVFVVSAHACKTFSMHERKRKVKSMIAAKKENGSFLLVRFFDEYGKLVSAEADIIDKASIPKEQLSSYAQEGVKRIDEMVRQQESYREIGRNEPCPCGSGKKYKKCHGAPTRNTIAYK